MMPSKTVVARLVLRHKVSTLRHSFITGYDPPHGVSISTLCYEYPRGFHVKAHAHASDQLVFAIRGVMQILAGQRVWLIPPHFAIWIPAGAIHSLVMSGPVSMRTLYIRPRLSHGMPSTCSALHITSLLRELIIEVVRIKQLRRRNSLHCALRDLLIAQLQSASAMPTSITMPIDPRARAISDAIFANPAERRSLATLCRRIGVSVRTIQRIFLREVGSDFQFWRRQARLIKAVEFLVDGRSVKETSFALGYRQPTAFVQMFRGILGITPGAWIQALRSKGSS
jgi:AraC-like DNA-binding protein/quercetin dioxygenase-like cupin family protein